MIIRSIIINSFHRIRNNINKLVCIIIGHVPLSLITGYCHCMINIITFMFSTRIDSESNISAVSQITDIPGITSITSTISQSTINKLKVTAWEEIPQSNIGCISTITSIRHNNSPNSNIINKVLILITSNINRNINNRNRINSQISRIYSTIRTNNSQIISQITKRVNVLIVISNIINESTISNQIA